jgi:hypothetical protein
MKHLKMLGLAVVAAAALTAVFGAGSASATELCSTNTNPCTGTMYPAGTVIHADLKAGTEAVLTAGFATVKCSVSTVEIKTTNTGGAGETVKGNIEALTFPEASCNCKVTITAKGSGEIHTDKEVSDGNGTLTGTGTRATINCSGVSCIFGTEGTDIGTLHGSATDPILTANASLKYFAGDASNFVCTLGSGTGSWKAEYTVTKPLGLFVI